MESEQLPNGVWDNPEPDEMESWSGFVALWNQPESEIQPVKRVTGETGEAGYGYDTIPQATPNVAHRPTPGLWCPGINFDPTLAHALPMWERSGLPVLYPNHQWPSQPRTMDPEWAVGLLGPYMEFDSWLLFNTYGDELNTKRILPNNDYSDGEWVKTSTGTNVSLFDAINEPALANQLNDSIKLPIGANRSSVCDIKMVIDSIPVNSKLTVNCWAKASASGGSNESRALRFDLMRVSDDTTISSSSSNGGPWDLTDEWVEYSFDVHPSEMALIDGQTFLRFSAFLSVAGDAVDVFVGHAELIVTYQPTGLKFEDLQTLPEAVNDSFMVYGRLKLDQQAFDGSEIRRKLVAYYSFDELSGSNVNDLHKGTENLSWSGSTIEERTVGGVTIGNMGKADGVAHDVSVDFGADPAGVGFFGWFATDDAGAGVPEEDRIVFEIVDCLRLVIYSTSTVQSGAVIRVKDSTGSWVDDKDFNFTVAHGEPVLFYVFWDNRNGRIHWAESEDINITRSAVLANAPEFTGSKTVRFGNAGISSSYFDEVGLVNQPLFGVDYRRIQNRIFGGDGNHLAAGLYGRKYSELDEERWLIRAVDSTYGTAWGIKYVRKQLNSGLGIGFERDVLVFQALPWIPGQTELIEVESNRLNTSLSESQDDLQLLQDNFNENDDETLVSEHTSDSGHSWELVALNGFSTGFQDSLIIGDKVQSDVSTMFSAQTSEQSSSDIYFEMRFRLSSISSSLCFMGAFFRKTDSDNYWMAHVSASGLTLYKCESGVIEEIEFKVAYHPVDQDSILKVMVRGSQIWLITQTFDGFMYANIDHVSTFNQDARRYGIFSKSRFSTQYNTIDNVVSTIRHVPIELGNIRPDYDLFGCWLSIVATVKRSGDLYDVAVYLNGDIYLEGRKKMAARFEDSAAQQTFPDQLQIGCRWDVDEPSLGIEGGLADFRIYRGVPLDGAVDELLRNPYTLYEPPTPLALVGPVSFIPDVETDSWDYPDVQLNRSQPVDVETDSWAYDDPTMSRVLAPEIDLLLASGFDPELDRSQVVEVETDSWTNVDPVAVVVLTAMMATDSWAYADPTVAAGATSKAVDVRNNSWTAFGPSVATIATVAPSIYTATGSGIDPTVDLALVVDSIEDEATGVDPTATFVAELSPDVSLVASSNVNPTAIGGAVSVPPIVETDSWAYTDPTFRPGRSIVAVAVETDSWDSVDPSGTLGAALLAPVVSLLASSNVNPTVIPGDPSPAVESRETPVVALDAVLVSVAALSPEIALWDAVGVDPLMNQVHTVATYTGAATGVDPVSLGGTVLLNPETVVNTWVTSTPNIGNLKTLVVDAKTDNFPIVAPSIVTGVNLTVDVSNVGSVNVDPTANGGGVVLVVSVDDSGAVGVAPSIVGVAMLVVDADLAEWLNDDPVLVATLAVDGLGWTMRKRAIVWTFPILIGDEMTALAIETLEKRPGESIRRSMDFSRRLEDGDNIDSIDSITVSPTTVPALTISETGLNGVADRAVMRIEGGRDGVRYIVSVVVSTVGGDTLTGDGYLHVEND